MRTAFDPFSFLVTSIAGWMNEHQHHVIDYLMEENRVLREQIGKACRSERCLIHGCGDGNNSPVQVRVDVVASCDAIKGESVGFECAGEIAGGDIAGNVQTVTTTAGDSNSIAVGIGWPFSIRICTRAWSSSLMRCIASSRVSPHVIASSISGQCAWYARRPSSWSSSSTTTLKT